MMEKEEESIVESYRSLQKSFLLTEETLKQFIDKVRKKDADKISELEMKISDPVDATNEFSLKKMELEQNERLENQKLAWEQKKWELERESYQKQNASEVESIRLLFEGPFGELIKESFRERKKPREQDPSDRMLANVRCPSCTSEFPANINLHQVQCPICGVQLEQTSPKIIPEPKQEQPAPQPQETDQKKVEDEDELDKYLKEHKTQHRQKALNLLRMLDEEPNNLKVEESKPSS